MFADDDEWLVSWRRPDLRVLGRLVKPYLIKYRTAAWSVTGLLVLQTIFNAGFPLATQHLIDDGLIGHDRHTLVVVLVFLAAAAVAVSVITIIDDLIQSRLSANLVKDLRLRLFEHLQTLPIHYFKRTPSGEILSRFSGDVVSMETLLTHILGSFIMPALEVIYATALMFYFNAWLGLIGLLVFPMIVGGPRVFSRRAFGLSYDKRTREARLLSTVQEAAAAQPVVRAFGLGGRIVARYRRQNARWFDQALRINFLSSLVESSAHMGVYVIHIVILGLGAYWAFTGLITVGTLVAFEAMFVSMGYALATVAQFVPTFASASGAAQHIEDLLREPSNTPDQPGAIDLPRLAERITFDKVSFAFPDGRQVLDDLSLSIPKNTFVAIVGRSGSGKSTILNLLLRFYEPTSGRLTIDGIDCRTATRASLRDQIGLVSQDNFLFNTTIRDNVRMGAQTASEQEIVDALKEAEAWDMVEAMPAGLDTIVGERGERLSGGQRQRIALARALVRKPAILVLDEATSALDSIAEAAVNTTLRHLAAQHTIITVTHRLANIATADKIIMLRDGMVVEEGKHAELLALNGHYMRLWNVQQGQGYSDL